MEIDSLEPDDKIKNSMTTREKIAIYILCLIFSIVYPAKYSHQHQKMMKNIFN